MKETMEFYHGKKVFVIRHMGFKGAWLCKMLTDADAEVTGYALAPADEPNLYEMSGVVARINSVFSDVRDRERL